MVVEGSVAMAWANYSSSTLARLSASRRSAEFADVTLACEGEGLVPAHRLVLAAGSSFFQTVLRKMGGQAGGQAGGQQFSSTYPAMEAPAIPGYSGPGPAGDFLGFGEPGVSTHDQSSEEIWDMDAHTVRRYNPVPDPVSPGPIPTTPTMYGMGQGGSYPYGRGGGLAPPLSPGLVPSPWGPMGMKGHASLSEAKRPKTYQCEACDKW